jgi:hypothetical protein
MARNHSHSVNHILERFHRSLQLICVRLSHLEDMLTILDFLPCLLDTVFRDRPRVFQRFWEKLDELLNVEYCIVHCRLELYPRVVGLFYCRVWD